MLEAMANYQDERAAFEALWAVECQQRVVFYRGQSGCGKTTLLKLCRKRIPDSMHQLFIDFKSSISVIEVFYRAVSRLGWQNLPSFQAALAVFQPSIVAQIDNNQIHGQHNAISQVINVDSLVERRERQAHLTKAWLDDVQALDKSLLLVIDTYENAVEEVKAWVNYVLTCTPDHPRLRLVLAGQQVPEVEMCAEEWVDCCGVYDLYGVKEAEHWLPVVAQMGRVFPVGIENPHDYLAGICAALQGRPAAIKSFIEKFPPRQN